jgi:hypothetical protein
MPCTVCSAWPTWADLSECERAECPWTLDPRLPIPPLPQSLRTPPPNQAISPPAPVRPQPAERGPLPAVVNVVRAPAHSWASLAAAMAVADAKPKTPAPPKPKPAPTAAAAAVPVGPRFSSRRIQDDYDNIMRYVRDNNWSGSFGPTCNVDTRLKWEDDDCVELYLAVKDDLHDKSFTFGKRVLYYYVGAIGNWGKAGFRISGHTKPSGNVGNSKTHGVLHIDN